MGEWKFWPPVDLKPLKILKPNLDWMITSCIPTRVPIFLQIGLKGSAPQIGEITNLWLSVPSLLFLSLFFLSSPTATRKLCYRKDDRAMPPCDLYMDALKFLGLPDYAHRYYSQHFSWAFVPIEAMNVRTNFEVRSFTRSWDNRGYPKNLGTPWIRPRSIFSKIFNGLLFGLAL